MKNTSIFKRALSRVRSILPYSPALHELKPQLTNKKNSIDVLITGAAGGIGKALTEAFTNHGYIVKGIDRGDLDITNDAAVEKFMQDNHFDIIVNNAGIIKDARMVNMTTEMLDDVMDVNFRAAWVITKHALPHMLHKEFGRIINISSVNAFGCFGQTNYSASKAALLGMSKSLALEVASKNITVNSICPGYAATSMVESLVPEVLKKIVDKIPQKRLVDPLDIAQTAVFLASDSAKSITGSEIHINGGLRT